MLEILSISTPNDRKKSCYKIIGQNIHTTTTTQLHITDPDDFIGKTTCNKEVKKELQRVAICKIRFVFMQYTNLIY